MVKGQAIRGRLSTATAASRSQAVSTTSVVSSNGRSVAQWVCAGREQRESGNLSENSEMRRVTARLLSVATGICLAVGVNTHAELIGTAFTYQGQLKEGGVPITGTAGLGFTLWDAASGGTQIGSVSFRSVEVENGLFVVELNFDSTVFDGTAYWLEIAVRFPADEISWTTLTPRQPVTPTPYALYALSGPGGGGGHWTLTGNNIYNNNTGKVGIGTSNPNFTLEVYKGGGSNTPPATLGVHWVQSALPQSFHDWFYFAVGGSTPTVGSGTRMIRESGTELHFQTKAEISSGTPSTQMVLDADGKLGIGVMSPAGLLHLASPGGIELRIDADTNNSGENDNAGITFTQDGYQVAGRIGYRSGLNKLEIMQQYHDSLILGANNIDAIVINDEGKVGIGRTDADSRLDVQENSGQRMANFTQLGTGQGVRITTTNPSNLNAALTVVGMNRDIPALEVAGTASVNVLQVTGADIAEKFPVSESVEPGMVVAIDPDHPGQLRLSRTAYDRRVAGVVSGANGLPAGAVLGHLPGLDDAPAIALTGRVWVYCDASNHAITPGDLLTTAETPGHAMKVMDYSRAHGAIIGKAMTSLDGGRGMVLVLVGLQ